MDWISLNPLSIQNPWKHLQTHPSHTGYSPPSTVWAHALLRCLHCLWCLVETQTPPQASAQVQCPLLARYIAPQPSCKCGTQTKYGTVDRERQRNGYFLTSSTTFWSTLSLVSSSRTISWWPSPQASRKQSWPFWTKSGRPSITLWHKLHTTHLQGDS